MNIFLKKNIKTFGIAIIFSYLFLLSSVSHASTIYVKFTMPNYQAGRGEIVVNATMVYQADKETYNVGDKIYTPTYVDKLTVYSTTPGVNVVAGTNTFFPTTSWNKFVKGEYGSGLLVPGSVTTTYNDNVIVAESQDLGYKYFIPVNSDTPMNPVAGTFLHHLNSNIRFGYTGTYTPPGGGSPQPINSTEYTPNFTLSTSINISTPTQNIPPSILVK